MSFAVLRSSQSLTPPPLPLPGLIPETRYRVEHLQLDRERRGSNRSRLSWLDDGLTIDGRSLALVGMQLPALYPESAMVLHLRATD